MIEVVIFYTAAIAAAIAVLVLLAVVASFVVSERGRPEDWS